ncbi:MAG: peptide-methionine (S)-S-oxide reductase MsrA [Bacteroidales bacterium]
MKAIFIILAVVVPAITGLAGAANPIDMKNNFDTDQIAHATLGGGCFWCMDAVFSRVEGVKQVTTGYAGGEVENPTYEMVSRGNTGHAEVVQITFNPEKVSYLQLLEVFFRVHNPTTPNRQGADVGPQYRSAIFYHNEEQKRIAEQVKDRMEGEKIWDDPIVTEITPLNKFYAAEEYHQNYFEKNPQQGYCQMVIQPKVEKFRQMFEDLLKEQ